MPEPVKTYKVNLICSKKKYSLKVSKNETILEAALQADINLPYLCLQGWCTTCAGKIIKGKVDQSRAFRLFSQDEEEGFVLLCSAFPKSNLIIRTDQKEEIKKFRISKNLPVPRG